MKIRIAWPLDVARQVYDGLTIVNLLAKLKALYLRTLRVFDPVTHIDMSIAFLQTSRDFVKKYTGGIFTAQETEPNEFMETSLEIENREEFCTPESKSMFDRDLTFELMEKLNLVDTKSLASLDTFSTRIADNSDPEVTKALEDLREAWKKVATENFDLKVTMSELQMKIGRAETVIERSNRKPKIFRPISLIPQRRGLPLHSSSLKKTEKENTFLLSLASWDNVIQNYEMEMDPVSCRLSTKFQFTMSPSTSQAIGSYCSRFNNGPDTTMLAVGSQDGNARVYNWKSNIPSMVFEHGADVYGLDFNAFDSLLVSTCEDGKVRIYDVMNQKVMRTYTQSDLHATYGVKFSQANINHFATTCFDVKNSVNLFDVRIEKPILSLNCHSEDVVGIDFSLEDNLLATSGDDKKAFIHDLRNPYEPLVYESKEELKNCKFLPNKALAICDNEGRVCVIDPKSTESLGEFGTHSATCFDAQFLQLGDTLLAATASHDGTAGIFVSQ